MHKRNSLVVVIFLTVTLLLALYLRTVGLSAQGLGYDEVFHIYAAKSIIQDGSPSMPSGIPYNRALPFTYSVALSFKLFGVSVFSARLPAVVFSMLSILIVFLIATTFFDRSVGILAALFMAFVPFEVVWSRTCRMYSMYQFLFLCAFYAFYRGFEKQSNLTTQQDAEQSPSPFEGIFSILRQQINWRWIFLTALFAFLAFKVQVLVMLFGVSIFVYIAVLSFVTLIWIGFRSDQTKKYLFTLAVALVFGAIFFLLLGFYSLVQELRAFAPRWAANNEATAFAYLKFLFSPNLIPLMFFFLLGALQTFTRMSRSAFYTVTCVVVPLVIHSTLVSVQRPRYIYDIFPLFLLISAYGVRNTFAFELTNLLTVLEHKVKLTATLTKLSTLSLMVLFAVIFFIPTPTVLKGLTINQQQAAFFGGMYNADWRAGCKYLAKNRMPGDILIASAPLAANFYGCRIVDYKLDNGDIDQCEKIEGTPFLRHTLFNVYAITDLTELKKVISQNTRGWIMVDKQRFNNPVNIPTDIEEFMTSQLKRNRTPADSTMRIFSWDRGRGIP